MTLDDHLQFNQPLTLMERHALLEEIYDQLAQFPIPPLIELSDLPDDVISSSNLGLIMHPVSLREFTITAFSTNQFKIDTSAMVIVAPSSYFGAKLRGMDFGLVTGRISVTMLSFVRDFAMFEPIREAILAPPPLFHQNQKSTNYVQTVSWVHKSKIDNVVLEFQVRDTRLCWKGGTPTTLTFVGEIRPRVSALMRNDCSTPIGFHNVNEVEHDEYVINYKHESDDPMVAGSYTKIVACDLVFIEYKDNNQKRKKNEPFNHNFSYSLIMSSDVGSVMGLNHNLEEQPPPLDDAHKFQELVAKILAECIKVAEEPQNGDFLSSICNRNMEYVKIFRTMISGNLAEQLYYNFHLLHHIFKYLSTRASAVITCMKECTILEVLNSWDMFNNGYKGIATIWLSTVLDSCSPLLLETQELYTKDSALTRKFPFAW